MQRRNFHSFKLSFLLFATASELKMMFYDCVMFECRLHTAYPSIRWIFNMTHRVASHFTFMSNLKFNLLCIFTLLFSLCWVKIAKRHKKIWCFLKTLSTLSLWSLPALISLGWVNSIIREWKILWVKWPLIYSIFADNTCECCREKWEEVECIFFSVWKRALDDHSTAHTALVGQRAMLMSGSIQTRLEAASSEIRFVDNNKRQRRNSSGSSHGNAQLKKSEEEKRGKHTEERGISWSVFLALM